MRRSSECTVIKKVYAYILKRYKSEDHLLVFAHLDFPEAGIQVSGGTVELEESIPAAVMREVQEETGLDCVKFVEKLGVSINHMSCYGMKGLHERHYFHCRVTAPTERSWIAYEETPSDGTPGSIALKFYWVILDSVPSLAGRTDEMLPRLINRLRNETG